MHQVPLQIGQTVRRERIEKSIVERKQNHADTQTERVSESGRGTRVYRLAPAETAKGEPLQALRQDGERSKRRRFVRRF
jgi:hypothetical protein